MEIFLICLGIIAAAFAIALLVWCLFKPKRESVVLIRPSTTRPNIIHKQGSGFGLDLAQQLAHLKTTGQEDYQARQAFLAMSQREQTYQNEQAAARRAAEQNRQDEAERESWLLTQLHRSEPSCHSSSDSSSSSSSDSGSSSSSSWD